MTELARIFDVNSRHLKKFGRLVVTLSVLTLVAVPWARSVIADGDEPRISYSEMRTKGRPGDFYKLGFSANDRVCRRTLQLLNQSVGMPSHLRAGYDYAKIDTAFFLRTRENVAWEPQWLITAQSKNGRAGVLDLTTADVFNNGKSLRLLRFELSVSSNLSHSLYAFPAQQLEAYLGQSDEVAEGLPVVTLVTPLYELKPYKLDLDPSFARRALGAEDYPWAGVLADVIEVEGKSYVLVTSAIERYRQSQIYLVEFLSHKNRMLVCEYGSDYLFVDE
jgi:hypothetical protein